MILQIKEISIFSEIFLSISIIFLTLHGVFLSYNKFNKFLLLQNSILSLAVLILVMSSFLIFNEHLFILDYLSFNYSISNDYLSFLTKILIGVITIFFLLIIEQYLLDQKINHFEYILIILYSVLGLFLLCSANDLITAYLAIELQSLSFYLLAAFKKNSTFSIEAGLKYFILGAFSSGLFLFGASIVYGVVGSINFDDFKDLFFWLSPGNKFEFLQTNLLQFGLTFILISLFFKLALLPFHLWAPDVYEKSPTSSSFFFAVVPKIAIFVLLLRICYYSFFGFIDCWRYYIIIISFLSVLVGSFAGLEQRKLKSLMAYSSISHMGYLLISFSTGSIEGIQMLFNYIIIYMISGFCIWGIFILTRLKNNYSKKGNKDLGDLTLLKKSNKILAFVFSLTLFSVAGLPPMVGFFVKFGVFLSAIEASMYFVALFNILFSVISTFYYIRIIKILYFEKILVGKLYYPIKTEKFIIIFLFFYLFIFLFINPTFLYLISYKVSLLFF